MRLAPDGWDVCRWYPEQPALGGWELSVAWAVVCLQQGRYRIAYMSAIRTPTNEQKLMRSATDRCVHGPLLLWRNYIDTTFKHTSTEFRGGLWQIHDGGHKVIKMAAHLTTQYHWHL